ncbi:MAG: hypothetical protein NXI31_11605 [bacterium]|nr:hypothetical protein [bacterium]
MCHLSGALRLLLCGLGLGLALPAQEPAPRSFLGAFGVNLLDGVPIAAGRDYQAEFFGDCVVYTPALPAAERVMPFAICTVSYGRGDAALVPAAAEPRMDKDEKVVRYERGAFVERYEARRDGVKQSFVFDALPPGSGDLVVRLRVETELEPSALGATDGGLEFRHGDVGGVTLGAVVGIDANGVRAAGKMRFADGELELRLPAAFVDGAALPLELDPLIGTTIQVGGGYQDLDTDVAANAGTHYLVVWRRAFSGGGHAVRGALVNRTGVVSPTLITIQTPGNNFNPRCTMIRTANSFVVVYSRSGNIYGRAISSTTLAVGLESGLAVTSATESDPDVGGESVADDEVLVVWRDSTNNRIEAKQVNVNDSIQPPVLGPSGTEVIMSNPPTGATEVAPAISKTGGTTGLHCIAWHRNQTNGLTDIMCRIVTRDLGYASIVLTAGTGGDNDVPDVDGDGRNWLIAWEWESTSGSGRNDVRARSLAFSSQRASGDRGFFQSPVWAVAATSADERAAKVAWMGDSALVMFERGTGTPGVFDAIVQPVDLMSGRGCGPALALPLNGVGSDQGPIRAVSRAGVGIDRDEALIVWSERDTGGDNDAFVIRFEADDGENEELGGGCGTRGFSYAECAMTGNSAFAMRWRNAIPNASAWLLMSPDRFNGSCSSCRMIADPLGGFVLPRTTDGNGSADVAFSIPATSSLVGASLVHQWVVFDTASPACTLFNFDMSDAYRTTIQ